MEEPALHYRTSPPQPRPIPRRRSRAAARRRRRQRKRRQQKLASLQQLELPAHWVQDPEMAQTEEDAAQREPLETETPKEDADGVPEPPTKRPHKKWYGWCNASMSRREGALNDKHTVDAPAIKATPTSTADAVMHADTHAARSAKRALNPAPAPKRYNQQSHSLMGEVDEHPGRRLRLDSMDTLFSRGSNQSVKYNSCPLTEYCSCMITGLEADRMRRVQHEQRDGMTGWQPRDGQEGYAQHERDDQPCFTDERRTEN
eukprot:GHVO01039294.1.p1 GENE.GHVO01039294.1~~GHVO01039294.1.p1  ORF type:complete len:259 (-),score=27.38 GHVO01039294.1:434-1210(-)